jgi:uncharacterized RDD family membrane protein YckC
MVALRLFGAIHTDRRGKVRSEFERAAEGVDAVFLEYPADGFSFRGAGMALARAPLAAVGLLLAAIVQWPLYALLVRAPFPAEIVAARQYAQAHDLPVHAVDDHPVQLLASADARVMGPNWLAFLAVVAFDPVPAAITTLAVTLTWTAGSLLGRLDRRVWSVGVIVLSAAFLWVAVGTLVFSGLLIVSSVFALLVTTITTLENRNEVMIERIAEISDRNAYDAVILTTGRAHLPGLRTAATEVGVDVPREYVPKLFRRGTLREPDLSGDSARRVADPDSAEAVLGRRIVAGGIDFVGSIFGAVAGAFAGEVVSRVVAGAVGGDPLGTLGLTFGALLGGLLYYVLPEAQWGKTPGKAALGLVVVDTDGNPVSGWSATFRNLFRPFDAVTLYVLVLVGVWSGRQRLGDRAAGTVVARAGSSSSESPGSEASAESEVTRQTGTDAE